MKSNNQSGLSTLHIIIILAVVAVIFGLIAAVGTDTDPITQDTADTVNSDTPIVHMAQDIAENKTESVTAAANQRNNQIQTELGADSTPGGNLAATSEITTSPTADTTMAGTFESYSPEKLALANDGTVVLFFHANWCPSCRGLENDINAKLGQIPANTHILKLDYDTETELRRQYGVIRQHTLVVVDANGTEIRKLTGLTNTLDQVVNQL